MLLCAVSPCGGSVGGWRRAHSLPPAGRSRADRVRRHRISPLHQAALCVLLDAQAQRRRDRIFPCAGGRDAGGAGPQPSGAAGARVRRAAGWARQAGLREHGGATLARRPWPELRKARSRLSRRRPLLPPADLPGGAGGGRAFPVRLQAVVPSDHRGISDRGRTFGADKTGQARPPAVHPHLSMVMRRCRCATAPTP